MSLRKVTHCAIHAIERAIQQYHLNKYIALLREFATAIHSFETKEASDVWAVKEALVAFVQMLAPVMPHLAQELWEHMYPETFVHHALWPVYEEDLLQESFVTMAVQINGKSRGTIEISADADEAAVLRHVLETPKFKALIGEGAMQRVIIIPQKIVSIVV